MRTAPAKARPANRSLLKRYLCGLFSWIEKLLVKPKIPCKRKTLQNRLFAGSFLNKNFIPSLDHRGPRERGALDPLLDGELLGALIVLLPRLELLLYAGVDMFRELFSYVDCRGA